MPRYRFDGHFETVLHGLQHGVNAVLHRDGHAQPDESTVVAQPGDEISTGEPYVHAHLIDLDAKPARKAAAAKAPARKAAADEAPTSVEPVTTSTDNGEE